MSEQNRTCRNCTHFIEGAEINCWEGGASEIGDPDRILTGEDCNAWEQKTKLKCVLCGNEREFRIRGTIIEGVDNKISGKGVIEPSQPERLEPAYREIVCPKCNANVIISKAKEEADKIISGAYEILRRGEGLLRIA